MKRNISRLPWLALLLTTILAAGCYGGGDERYAPPPAASAGADAPAAAETAPPAGGLPFELPAGWREETPSSNMRLAQAVIPGPAGDAELAVFFFGPGGGGGVEDNILRWIGQVEPTAEPVRGSFAAGPYQVSWVEVDGTLKAGQMGGPAEAQPGSTLLGAVVEGPGGPWFFKATGPEATLEDQKDELLDMLRELG